MSRHLLSHFAAFPDTRWSLVAMVQGSNPEQAAFAMAALCEAYWYPIYAFLRRSGRSAHDAQDLAQAFFHELISEDALLAARKESGKLRSYLLGVLMRQLSDVKRSAAALKRGGNVEHVSFDQMEAEERYAHEPVDHRDPSDLYSQAWAHALLEQVREELRQHFIATHQEPVFELLLPFLTLESNPPPQREVALALGTSEAAAGMFIHRLRHKFRLLLHAEVAKTVLLPADLDDELAWLRSVLAGETRS